MGIEPTSAPNIIDKNPQSPEHEKALDQEGQNPGGGALREISAKSESVNSGPMREELVQLAVNFLSHPTVRGYPVIYRRSFLEKKGLTNEEIDAAFRCVPDPPSSVTDGQSPTSNKEDDDGTGNTSKPSLSKETTEAVKAAAAAAVNAAKASLEMLNSKNEERRYFEALMKRLDIQVAEMRSMSNLIWKLEGAKEAAMPSHKQPEQYTQHPSKSVRPSPAPASMAPSVGQHPKSFMEVMAMIQRGEKPPGIREINDSPPNPDQPLPNPSFAPRIKPWEVAQAHGKSTYAQNHGLSSQSNGSITVPLWQHNNVRIAELKPEDGMRADIYGAMTNKRSVQWS